MTMDEITKIAEQVMKIGLPISIGVGATWRWVIHPYVVKPSKKFVSDINFAIETIHDLAPKVREMSEAFGQNGGKNLHASITRTAGRVSQLIDQSEIPTWEADSDGRNTRTNPAFERLLGYSASDLRGNGWMTLLHEDDGEEYFVAWEAAVKGRYVFQREVRFRARDRRIIFVHVFAAPCPAGLGLWLGTIRVLKEIL